MTAAVASSAASHESHPEVGKIGIWLFLLSEILLFGGFLASYVLLRWSNDACRLGVVAWPREGYAPALAMATVNTLLLITSSLTMAQAVHAAKHDDHRSFSSNLRWTILMGFGFLVVKAFEYSAKIHHGYWFGSDLLEANPGFGIFVTSYFTLTGLHGLHVIAGLVWNGVLLKYGSRTDGHLGRKAEYAGLYWHFVDVVWVFLFPLFYLI